MQKTLYLFNPDHDLALAHGRFHYVSPASATAFANDVATLPAWIYDGGDVWVPDSPSADFLQICDRFQLHSQFVDSQSAAASSYGKIVPWGWNFNLKKRLEKSGLQCPVKVTDEVLDRIRELSHRRISVRAADYLKQHFSRPDLLPPSAEELTDMDSAVAFLKSCGAAIFKMPWSGSGRGLRRVDGQMSTHQFGWVQQSIRKFGCIMAEPFHQVAQDFAMEFLCDDSGAHFVGYSLFNTHHGVYTDNVLLPDGEILSRLSRFIPQSYLFEIQQLLTSFIENEILPFYRGCVGIDMFFYNAGSQYRVNPFVEINLRTTMGYVSAVFVQKFLGEGTGGSLRMRYLPDDSSLLAEHQLLSAQHPLIFDAGKLVSGYLSLNPITQSTHYAVQVLASQI